MKKSFMTLAAVLCCAMMMSLMNSCKDNNQPTPEDKKKSAKLICMFQANADLRNYCDITIEYYDSEGNTKSEQLSQEKWEKTITADMPCKLGMHVTLQIKEGLDPSTIPSFTAAYAYQYQPLSDGSNPIGRSLEEETSPEAGKLSELIDYINQQEGGLVNYVITFDKNGNYTEGKW